MDTMTARMPGLVLVALATTCLALHGYATALWLAPLLSPVFAFIAASCLAVLRIALPVPSTNIEWSIQRALLSGALIAVGMLALSSAIAPVLPALFPVGAELPPVWLGAAMLAICFEIATRAAVGLAVRHHLPEFQRCRMLHETRRERETEVIAELLAEGLESEAQLRRARRELAAALQRIERQLGHHAPGTLATTNPPDPKEDAR